MVDMRRAADDAEEEDGDGVSGGELAVGGGEFGGELSVAM